MLHHLRFQNTGVVTANLRQKPAVKAKRRPGLCYLGFEIAKSGEPEVRTSARREFNLSPSALKASRRTFIAKMKLNLTFLGRLGASGPLRRAATLLSTFNTDPQRRSLCRIRERIAKNYSRTATLLPGVQTRVSSVAVVEPRYHGCHIPPERRRYWLQIGPLRGCTSI